MRRVAVLAYTEYALDPRVRREAEALVAHGYQVSAITLRPRTGPGTGVLDGVRLYQVPLTLRRGGKTRYLYQYGMFSLLGAVVLLFLHLRNRFDAVHIHSLPDFIVLCALPEKLMSAKLVLDLHESLPEIMAARLRVSSRGPWMRLARSTERASAAFADKIIAVSPLRAALLGERGIERTKIVVVPNSSPTIPEGSASSEELRAEQGLNGKWVFVEAGGINPERDLESVVRAVGILSHDHPCSLLLFGKGEPEYVDGLKRLAVRESSAVDFRLGGWIPHELVPRYLRLSEIGLITYQRNPLTELASPNKILECAAAKRPLVVANVRSLRHEWGDAAIFYEPGDAEDLAAKIRMVMNAPALASRLTTKALEVYSTFSWEHARETLLAMFDELTDREFSEPESPHRRRSRAA